IIHPVRLVERQDEISVYVNPAVAVIVHEDRPSDNAAATANALATESTVVDKPPTYEACENTVAAVDVPPPYESVAKRIPYVRQKIRNNFIAIFDCNRLCLKGWS